MSPSNQWKLYSVPAILESEPEHGQGKVSTQLGWDQVWSEPQGVAIVGLAASPGTSGGTDPATFCLRNENGDVFPLPRAADVEVEWQRFAPIPVTQPYAMSPMMWPTGAEYALLLLLFRSPADMRYAPILSLQKNPKRGQVAFSKATWNPTNLAGASPASVTPTAAEVREAVAYEMRSRPITRADYSVLDLP